MKFTWLAGEMMMHKHNAKVPKCYVIITLPILLISKFRHKSCTQQTEKSPRVQSFEERMGSIENLPGIEHAAWKQYDNHINGRPSRSIL
jgi:hypothetical protein